MDDQLSYLSDGNAGYYLLGEWILSEHKWLNKILWKMMKWIKSNAKLFIYYSFNHLFDCFFEVLLRKMDSTFSQFKYVRFSAHRLKRKLMSKREMLLLYSCLRFSSRSSSHLLLVSLQVHASLSASYWSESVRCLDESNRKSYSRNE